MRLAYGLLGDADDAEDVMQDVMVYALSHLDRYDHRRAAFGTWLHVMTVSRCRDRRRRKRLGVERLARWLRDEQDAKVVDPDERLGRLDASTRIGRALDALTDIQREAVVLREIEGMSYREIGEVLSVPMRTAQTRVASGYSALRRALEQAGGSGAVDGPVGGDPAGTSTGSSSGSVGSGGRANAEGGGDV